MGTLYSVFPLPNGNLGEDFPNFGSRGRNMRRGNGKKPDSGCSASRSTESSVSIEIENNCTRDEGSDELRITKNNRFEHPGVGIGEWDGDGVAGGGGAPRNRFNVAYIE